MKNYVLCLGLVIGSTVGSPTIAAELSGQAWIGDGDTVEIGGKSVRLDAIDAPETDQICSDAKGGRWLCGIAAADALRDHTKGKTWRCEGTKEDGRGRLLATCFVNGEDVNKWLVSQGWALAYVKYSDRYQNDESEPRDQRKGLWGGRFCKPWEFRDGTCKTLLGSGPIPTQPLLDDLKGFSGKPPGENCTVKANLKAKHGECIYHMPGSHGFSWLKMGKPGTQWFCSEKQAQIAGCRAARR